MKKKMIRLIEAVVGFPPACVRALKNIGQQVTLACNAFTPGIHRESITKFSTAVIATRYLLAKSDGTATGFTICTSGDKADFVVSDTVSSTELSAVTPAPVNCFMLGASGCTVPMIAARAIACGAFVYPGLLGQADTYVGLGSTGTNYACGKVVAQPAAQAGDIIEVMPILAQVTTAL